MAEQSPKGGRYKLAVQRWRRVNENGGYTVYSLGDEMDLTDGEAARLATGKYPGVVKVQQSSVTQATTRKGE